MRKPLVVMFGIGAIVACSAPTSLCGCSPRELRASALIFGAISTSAGAPLRSALLNARGARGSCPGRGPAGAVSFVSFGTDSTGRYRLVVGLQNPATDSICVQVVAQRSAKAMSDTLVSAAVTLEARDLEPLDSARLDFRFP